MGITVSGKINNVDVTLGYARLNHVSGTAKKWNALLVIAESKDHAEANKFIYMDNLTVDNTDAPYSSLYNAAREKLVSLGLTIDSDVNTKPDEAVTEKPKRRKTKSA
jgi:hypothetical protein